MMKGEADGNNLPSAGLRQVDKGRAYFLWDHNSHLYIRRRNNTLYIPSLFISHLGKALGDKTIFRRSEKAL